MWMNKKQKLKASYYNSFFALIVIPILLIILPTILIYIFFQKYILSGIAAGAVKE